MNVHHGTESFSSHKPIVTIGMFDGVHLGHASVLHYVIDKAKALQGTAVVLSFWPHPRVCFEGSATKLRHLTSLHEKTELLAQFAIDHLVIQPFSKDFSSLSPEAYVKTILVDGIKAHTVIVGYDHNFGHKGAGDFALLKDLGQKYGFNVEQLPAFSHEGINVSSTKIRNALHSGDIENANRCLNYAYSISGTVGTGKQIGRTIGFPTANIVVDDSLKLIPHNGVYIISSIIRGKKYNGVVNIGTRPTIDDDLKKTTEAFFFDFDADIYNEPITIHFHSKIREELKFDSLEALKTQIQADVVRAKHYFSSNKNTSSK